MLPLIKFGYCYLTDMNPGRRSKPGKIRPVVSIQTTDVTSVGAPGVVIVPLTTQLREENNLRIRLTPDDLPGLSKPSDILVDQIHTVDRSLFLKELGPVPTGILKRTMEGVFFILGKPE